MSYIISILVGISLLQAAGCADGHAPVQNPGSEHLAAQNSAVIEQNDSAEAGAANLTRPPTRYKDIIGPQFYPYSLDKYEPVDHDILPVLSGRFVSVRYRLKDGESISRESLEHEISLALLDDGWERGALPEREPMTEIYRLNKQDLYFTRGSFAPDDDVYTYNQRISINEDGTEIVCYWEAFWS